MRRKKRFEYAKGKYYLTVKSTPTDITMYRKNQQDAVNVYNKYIEIGKTVEWHGKWNGKKFVEDEIEELEAA